MNGDGIVPHIQGCGLEAANEVDADVYDGIITIKDSTVKEPFRIRDAYPPQCILQFDDISEPVDDWVVPQEGHIRTALAFSHQWEQPSLLIHCRAGMSRSPALALAIFADCLGEGSEEEAVGELLKIAPLCTPNRLVVKIADRELGRKGQLVSALEKFYYKN